MGTNSPKKVWVGVIGGVMLGVFDVKVCTSLKDLCEEIGSNYNTAKEKVGGGDGPVMLSSGEIGEMRAWSVTRVLVRKVVGRGKIGK